MERAVARASVARAVVKEEEETVVVKVAVAKAVASEAAEAVREAESAGTEAGKAVVREVPEGLVVGGLEVEGVVATTAAVAAPSVAVGLGGSLQRRTAPGSCPCRRPKGGHPQTRSPPPSPD